MIWRRSLAVSTVFCVARGAHEGTEMRIPKLIPQIRSGVLALTLALLAGAPAVTEAVEKAPEFKPGFNLFSPAQDVQVGRENAAQVEKQLPILKDAEVERYVNDLGRRLAGYSPNSRSEYVWQFKVVNSSDINAFALPGGFIYINRATIEAAQNEAQLAGVIAHEEGHVVMRHGTHQASEMMLAQAPLSILGGFFGQGGSVMGQLAELGIGLGVNSVFLHNSRSIEAQADQVGTYTLYHAGYDPHAMAQFFQIIEQKYPQKTLEFFSNHPNPDHRIEKVNAEIPTLGPAKAWKTDSPDFETIKKRLLGLPPPPKAQPLPQAPPSSGAGGPGSVAAPSRSFTNYQGHGFTLRYPDNWQVYEGQDNVVLAPSGGVWQTQQSGSVQAYGASISRQNYPSGNPSLRDATEQLVQSLRQSNPNMKVVNQRNIKVNGREALSTMLENDSPLQGQKERDNLVTLRSNDALLTMVFVAPEFAYNSYQSTFEDMLKSLVLQ